MNRLRPEEVAESVTMVAPGRSSSRMAEIRAMSPVAVDDAALPSTITARSPSASSSTPMSAVLTVTAWEMVAKAWGPSKGLARLGIAAPGAPAPGCR